MKAWLAILAISIPMLAAGAKPVPRKHMPGGLPATRAALEAEIAARKAGDAATLDAAKAYTDAQAGAGITVRPATPAECPNGGTAITASSGTQLVCNGAPGQQGPPGVGETMGYTKRGQWYDGQTPFPGGFSETFESGDQLLALDLPAGTYLLTAHVFLAPGRGDDDNAFLCSVGRSGGPVGSGEAKWLRAMDTDSSVAVVAVGTYYLATAGIADLRCYSNRRFSDVPDLYVAQASLTALRIDTLVYQQ